MILSLSLSLKSMKEEAAVLSLRSGFKRAEEMHRRGPASKKCMCESYTTAMYIVQGST